MATGADPKAEELTAIIQGIKDRVRARYADNGSAGLPLPDHLPVLHARDAAEAKVAAIGLVNPRPPGLVNNAIQSIKRQIARSLQWFVRDQVEFNRSLLVCVEALLGSLNEVNRTFAAVNSRLQAFEGALQSASAEALERGRGLQEEARALADIRLHWNHWREAYEHKLAENEITYLRGIADLRAVYEARALQSETSFGKAMEAQHAQYRAALDRQHGQFTGEVERAAAASQHAFWGQLERIRLEYETLIHTELRLIRQRSELAFRPVTPSAGSTPSPEPALRFDYTRFSGRFRGSEEYVRESQRFYLPFFTGLRRVADLGCGRGEFLELLSDAGVGGGHGVELSAESVAICQQKGLSAEVADLFEWLRSQGGGSLDGIFAAQLVEHLLPAKLPELLKLAAAKLRSGGVLILETPNPECLAIFARHFYLDPTHQRPIPAALLVFYLEEFGFGNIEVHRRSPALESMPSLSALPEDFRNEFFGGLDYAVTCRRL